MSGRVRTAGRPRSQETRAAILAAALRLVDERDSGEVTIKAIAEASGAGRQTLYRHWQNRGQIIMEALREAGAVQIVTDPETGVEAGVRQFLRATVSEARRLRRALAVVMIDAQSDPAFLEEFRNNFVTVRRAAFLALFDAGAAPMTRARRELLADLVYGPLWYRLLVRHAPLDARFADSLSAVVLGFYDASHEADA